MSNEITCAICGKQTTKRATLAGTYNGVQGRACREHHEATEAKTLAEKKEAEQKTRQKAERERKTEKRRKQYDISPEGLAEHRRFLKCNCWKCGVSGVSYQNFSYQMLLLLNLNKTDPEIAKNIYEGLQKSTKLALFTKKPGEWMKTIELSQTVELVGYTQLCENCAKKSGRDFDKAFNPELTEKQLKTGMAMSVIMKDEINEDAQALKRILSPLT
jgi:hypothetical protein